MSYTKRKLRLFLFSNQSILYKMWMVNETVSNYKCLRLLNFVSLERRRNNRKKNGISRQFKCELQHKLQNDFANTKWEIISFQRYKIVYSFSTILKLLSHLTMVNSLKILFYYEKNKPAISFFFFRYNHDYKL